LRNSSTNGDLAVIQENLQLPIMTVSEVDARNVSEAVQSKGIASPTQHNGALDGLRGDQVVARIIGEDVVGTQGTPVELLAGLIKNRMFPELWRVRTELTELAKQSD